MCGPGPDLTEEQLYRKIAMEQKVSNYYRKMVEKLAVTRVAKDASTGIEYWSCKLCSGMGTEQSLVNHRNECGLVSYPHDILEVTT